MPRFLVKILSVSLLLVLSLVLSDGAMPAAAQDTGSISGRVINDLNSNGTADPGEPGVEGWRVVLTRLFSMNPGSVVVAEARTGQGGDYQFSGIRPGVYEIDLPCDGQPAAQWTGIFPDRRAGRAFPIGSPDAESIAGMNFLIGGLVDPLRTDGEITGRMVNDRDADGTADRGEPGLAGWSVTMIRESPPLVCLGKPLPRESFRVATDSKGSFRAEGLVEGTYSVVDPIMTEPPMDAQTKVTHWAVTAPLAVFTIPGYGDTPVAVPTEVILTSRKMKADVGDTLVALLDGSGSISGYAFRDMDGNQKLDENEPMVYPPMVGLQYVSRLGPLWVYPAFPLVGVGTDGRYRFEDLSAGKYIVSASVYVGFLQDRTFYFGPFAVGEGETTADLPFPPLPPEPTRTPYPIPVQPVDVYAPEAGTGGASSDSGLASLAAVLAVMGTLAVSGAVLFCRRQTRKEGHHV